MEHIATFHTMILEKLRALLTNNFCDHESDAERCAEQERLIEENWNECNKAIEEYYKSIHFNDRIEKLKAELDRLEREEYGDGTMMVATRRTPRFFDDVDKSVGSLVIDNKRAFAKNLAEIDNAYSKMIESLSAELVEKRKKLDIEDNTY